MRSKYIWEVYKDGEFLTDGTLKEVAEELGLNENSLRYNGGMKRLGIVMKKRPMTYSLYKGDALVCEGTIDEIIAFTELKRTTLSQYATETLWKKRKTNNYTALVPYC